MGYVPYSRQWIDAGDIKDVVRSLKSDWITQGPRMREFEQALSRYAGAKYAVAVSGGTPALHLSLLALGVKEGDEVITSPITFSASANCALYVGARPRFVDIDDKTYQIDPEKLKHFLKSPSRRKRVKAIIVVHFMGMVSEIAEIKKLSDKYGIKIVEDAAHAMGAEYMCGNKWFKVGSSRHSEATMLSFHAIKHITTGEGGAILTNNRDIYKASLRLRHHGMIKRSRGANLWFYDIPEVGFNYRITDFQCALGNSQLKKLDSIVKTRRKQVEIYNNDLSGIERIRLPYERNKTRSSYHLYVIRIPQAKRNRLYKFLRKHNIMTQVNYIPVHFLSYYRRKFRYGPGDFPVAEKYYKECLSLPLYAGLKGSTQLGIIKRIKEFFKK